MTEDWVQRTIRNVEEATKQATKSRAAARKFLKDAGIITKDKPVKVAKVAKEN
jgi:hypothetical protein